MSRTSTSIELQTYAESIPVTQPSSIFVRGDDTPPLTDELRSIVNVPQNAVKAEQLQNPSKSTTAIVLVTVVCVTMISTLLAGLVTVGLPTMAAELDIPTNLLLW